MAAAAPEGVFRLKPWTIAVPLVLLGLIFLPTAVVLIAALIPAIVARLVDTSPGLRLTVTVGAMNLLGSLYFIDRIWSVGHGIGDIMPTLTDTMGWLCALVGAGAGWILFGLMTPVANRIAHAQTALRMRRLDARQEKLVEEWGEAVRGAFGVQMAPQESEEAAEG